MAIANEDKRSMANKSKALQKFKEFVAGDESRGSYNAMNQGTKTEKNSKGKEVTKIIGSSYDSKNNKAWSGGKISQI